MELFFVGLVALVVGFYLGAKLIAKGSLPGIKEMQKNQAIDRASYLFTLRRELANILIWRDPQRYVKLYQGLCSEFNSFKSWRLEEINKRLSELTKEYPFYKDFDTIGSKEYVLYPDAVSWNSYEKLESNYRDIATFVEFAIYTVFHFDEGGTSKSYYRSDSTFEKEVLLFSNPALLDELKRPL